MEEGRCDYTINKSSVRLFADDCVLYREIKNTTDADLLQEDLETLQASNINHKLNWNTHIDQVVRKANNTRAFLQRNIYQCPRKSKELCYKTLVRPQMEAARFVTGDSHRTTSVTNLLHQLQWPTLQERRAMNKVIMILCNNILGRTEQSPLGPLHNTGIEDYTSSRGMAQQAEETFTAPTSKHL
ncbi:uncharacterized protein LOC127737002 [Mytilus californianus]|uniref:uncharacterized protein LOC127737002 n=1 Tax=Mytilus californianus TaxID=6549 RepID=UPI0022460F79|nr:uncharacterized protein LOC127737002 [Mytilus californianus]